MASLLGGFSGKLNDHNKLEKIPVVVPAGYALTARSFRIQIFDPPCDVYKKGRSERVGQVEATVDALYGHIEHQILPQYRQYWTDLGILPAPERDGLVPGVVTRSDFDLCGCLRELGGCEPSDEAEALKINPSVDGEGFMVTLTVTIGHLDPGTSVTGMIALDDDAPLHAEGASREPENEAARR